VNREHGDVPVKPAHHLTVGDNVMVAGLRGRVSDTRLLPSGQAVMVSLENAEGGPGPQLVLPCEEPVTLCWTLR
jgi:hypothetical protein